MKNDPWAQLAIHVSTRHCDMTVLRERGNDVIIARVKAPNGNSVIVKCWNRRGLRGALRRLTRSNIGWREFTALRRLRQAGIPCPEPIAYRVLPRSGKARHTEALVSGDLGPCGDATERLKHLLKTDPDAARAFDLELIRATAAMISRGLIDTDHRLPNFVIPPGGGPVRIDFELCIPVSHVSLHPKRLGEMLGTFLGSYVFAVQPDTVRATSFARELLARVAPPASALPVASAVIHRMLNRQRLESGIDTRFDLLELLP